MTATDRLKALKPGDTITLDPWMVQPGEQDYRVAQVFDGGVTAFRVGPGLVITPVKYFAASCIVWPLAPEPAKPRCRSCGSTDPRMPESGCCHRFTPEPAKALPGRVYRTKVAQFDGMTDRARGTHDGLLAHDAWSTPFPLTPDWTLVPVEGEQP